tara:strand:- start:149 stop:538 length:390 start_codon:yes stop_codon:yes gene_type:complete
MSNQTHPSFLKFTVADLHLMGVLSKADIEKLEKKHVHLNAKRNKELRQDEVNSHVETHLLSITPGELFKHRAVWDAVGRDEFTRDEISKALNHHKENFLVEQVRKGPNNFQVFWQRTKMKLNCIIEIVD